VCCALVLRKGHCGFEFKLRVCLCIVSSGVGIGIATGCNAHRSLMKDLDTKLRSAKVTLTRMVAHNVTEHSNKQHNHVDTGNESL